MLHTQKQKKNETFQKNMFRKSTQSLRLSKTCFMNRVMGMLSLVEWASEPTGKLLVILKTVRYEKDHTCFVIQK